MKRISRARKNRNKRIRIYLASILKAFISLLRNVLELLVYLIILIIKFAYGLVFKFDTVIAKLFMKLPRITKAVIIYVLILTFILNLQQALEQKKPIKTIKEIKFAYVEPTTKEEIKEEVKQEPTCNYDEVSCKIYNKAKELGMNEEQSKITIAISRWETGNYTSSAFKNKNNVGGMMCQSGLINYNSLDEGIHAFVKNLKNNYFDIGLDTIDKIQSKYCPVGAKNDPNGLNKYWLNGVKEIYNTL
jgi:hypothetical protein